MSRPLSDRIALVTGASRGIGYATAVALAKAGTHVVAVARTVGGLEELYDAIRAEGGSATLVPLDLRDTDGIVRLAAALNERYQRLDVLVGNGGVLGPMSPLGHVEPAMALMQRRTQPGDAVGIGEIERHQRGAAASLADLVVELFQPALRARHSHDMRAALGERNRGGVADAARGAGDESDAGSEGCCH